MKGVKINWETLGQGIRVTITHLFPTGEQEEEA